MVTTVPGIVLVYRIIVRKYSSTDDNLQQSVLGSSPPDMPFRFRFFSFVFFFGTFYLEFIVEAAISLSFDSFSMLRQQLLPLHVHSRGDSFFFQLNPPSSFNSPTTHPVPDSCSPAPSSRAPYYLKMVFFLSISTLPSLCLPSSTNCTHRQLDGPLLYPFSTDMPTIQYLSTNPRFLRSIFHFGNSFVYFFRLFEKCVS